MRISVFEHAEDEIVFALRKEMPRHAEARQPQSEVRDRVRLPMKVDQRDLESAIDEMIEKFPKTLEYLAR